jgi:hypothetical protein
VNKNISLLEPTKGANRNTLLPPTTLRVYRSTEEGMVSVVMYRTVGGGVTAGTRLTVDQVRELRDNLTAFLSGVEVSA